MSHITQIDLRIRDLDALEEACEKLGLELQRDKRTFAWWGRFENDSRQYGEMTPEKMGTCEHAIKIKGTLPHNGSDSSCAWEIGVTRADDGDGFRLHYDQFAGGHGLTAIVEHDSNALRREYAAAVSTKKSIEKLSRLGWRAVREELPGKQIRIVLKKR